MAKKCSHCGFSIDDNEKIFCPNCGEFIDKELNLIKNLDKTLDTYEKNEQKTVTEKPEVKQVAHHKYDDDDSEIAKLKKTSSGGINTTFIIIIAVIIVIAIILKFVLF